MGDHDEQPVDDVDDGVDARVRALTEEDRRLVNDLVERLGTD